MPKKKRQTRAEIVYHAMCAESEKHKMPERFETDLHVHDRRFLDEGESEVFGWILYPNGTHIIAPLPHIVEWQIKDRIHTVRTPGSPEPVLYLVEGAYVNETTPRDLAYVLSGERDRDRRAGNESTG